MPSTPESDRDAREERSPPGLRTPLLPRRIPRSALGGATSRFLVPWTRLDWPVDWASCFGRERPVRAELGFGDGEFLVRAALAEPEINWVGVEISWYSVRRLLRSLEARGLENVRVLQADGLLALERLFGIGSLDALVANHSDPWPKQRHHGRRLIQDRFLAVAAARLRRGGCLTVATDHAEYAEWITRALERSSTFHSRYPTDRVHEIPGRPSTKYERKGRAAGSLIHYFVWETHREEIHSLPRAERIPAVHNVILEGEIQFPRLLQEFSGAEDHAGAEGDAIRVRLLHAYLRSDGGEWMVEARVDDGGFIQNLALCVAPRDGSRILVTPSSLGFPRPTPGVSRAVQLLATVLTRSHPELRVISSTAGNPDP